MKGTVLQGIVMRSTRSAGGQRWAVKTPGLRRFGLTQLLFRHQIALSGQPTAPMTNGKSVTIPFFPLVPIQLEEFRASAGGNQGAPRNI